MSHRILNISFAEIRKILSAISKLKGCEELKDWICPIENHFLWSATTTITGKGKVIWAKFISFLGHIINQHKNHKDPLFNKCAHGELNNRTWMTPDILLTFMEFLCRKILQVFCAMFTNGLILSPYMQCIYHLMLLIYSEGIFKCHVDFVMQF